MELEKTLVVVCDVWCQLAAITSICQLASLWASCRIASAAK